MPNEKDSTEKHLLNYADVEQRTQRRENISMSFLCPVLRYNTLGKANEFAGMYRRHSRRTQILCQ